MLLDVIWAMLMDIDYVVWGVAFDIAVTLVLGALVVSVLRLMKQDSASLRVCHGKLPKANAQRKNDRRVLMDRMNQKTDAMLSALAIAIEQERQKLGVIVRNPSISKEIDAIHAPAPERSGCLQTAYEQVLPLVQSGAPVETIARQLELSEAEVSLVMRLDAA